MQATDMFLGLIAKNGINTSETLPRKADLFPTDGGAFQRMFTQAVSKPKPVFDTPAAGGYNARKPAENAPATRETAAAPKDAGQPVVKVERQKAAERPAPEPKTQAEPAREKSEVAKTTPDAKPQEAEAAEKTAEATESREAEGAKAPEALQDEAAKAVQAAQETEAAEAGKTELVAKLEALIEKLEAIAAEKVSAEDEAALAELLVNLLALLLADERDAGTVENAQSPAVAVRLNLDPDSALSKLIDVLLAGKEQLDGADLADVKVLLKLTDEKGLLIPLTELVRNGTEPQPKEGETVKFTVQFTEADGGETVKLDLALSAEDVKAAQIVNLAETPVDESDLVMTIPLEKLAQASGVESLDALAAKLQQQGAEDGKLVKFLNALGISGRELAETLAANEAPEQKLQVAAPITLKQDGQAQKPVIATADSIYFQTDEVLKSMEAESLAKELTGVTKDRKELFDRLYKLLSEMEGKSDNFSKALIEKTGGTFFVKDWLENFGGQTKQEAQQWSSELFRDTLADKTADFNSSTAAPSERIAFLGRADAGNNLNRILDARTETAHTARGNDVEESVMRQIVQRVSYSFANGTSGEIRVFLRPDTLGEMTLKVRVDQDVVLAKITAQSHEVKAIVESNLGQLKNALEQHGIKVGQFEVTVDTGSGNNSANNGAEDRTGDGYLSQYSDGLETGGAGTGATPDVFDGDYAYSRTGSTPNPSSRYSYLA